MVCVVTRTAIFTKVEGIMVLVMVRHGQTDSNIGLKYCGQTDIELNETGKAQVARTAQRLYEMFDGRIDTIHSSPLKRAYASARIIAGRFGAAIERIIPVKEIAEANFGIFEDMSYDEIIQRYPQEFKQWRDDWENCVIQNGESSRMVYDRAGGFFKKFVEGYDSGTHVFVMHMGSMAHAISCLLDFGIGSYWRYRIDNGGVVIIRVNDKKFCHLAALNI
jgi:alpha-ribazole phosphatase